MSVPVEKPAVPHGPPPAPEPASYEAAASELERLVAAMEGGQMPLDQLLDSYRRGVELLAFCRERLAHYKAPRSVVFGPLPKTSTGKIQKHLLRGRV